MRFLTLLICSLLFACDPAKGADVMAFPFTRETTFTTGTAVTHGFLNDLQDGISAAAFPGYARTRCVAGSETATTIRLQVDPYMVLDAGTSKYVGMPGASVLLTSASNIADFLTGSDSWNYLYVQVTNGVAAYYLSLTPPESGLRYMSGTETMRYLFPVNFLTNVPYRFTWSRSGEFRYSDDMPLTALGAAVNTTAWQTLTPLIGSGMPTPAAKTLFIEAQVFNLSAGDATAYFRSGSVTGAGVSSCYTKAGTSGDKHLALYWNTLIGTLDYSWSVAAATLRMTIWVRGFEE